MNHLINEIQAAEQLGLTPSTLRKWRYLRKGPDFIKIGTAVRYNPDTIRAFIEKIHAPALKRMSRWIF